MANIALVTASVGDGASIAVINALRSLGHTVSAHAQSSSATSLTGFDLIVGTRLNSDASSLSSVVNAFNSGVPVIFGFNRDPGTGIGTSSDFLGGKLGLVSSIPSFGTTNSMTSLTADMGLDYPVGTTVFTNTAPEYCNYVINSNLATGATPYFSSPTAPSTNSAVGFAARGANSLLGTPFPAACAYAGFLYVSDSYFTADGQKLLGAIVEKVLALNVVKTHVISGHVLDENNTPLTNKVMLYSQDTNQLEATATPDADGKYSFSVVENTDFFIVCASSSSDKNYQIYAYVQGALV